MKKIYLKPSLKVVKITTNYLLGASNEYIDIKEDNYNDGDDIIIGSRGSHSIWGDEDEE